MLLVNPSPRGWAPEPEQVRHFVRVCSTCRSELIEVGPAEDDPVCPNAPHFYVGPEFYPRELWLLAETIDGKPTGRIAAKVLPVIHHGERTTRTVWARWYNDAAGEKLHLAGRNLAGLTAPAARRAMTKRYARGLRALALAVDAPAA